MSPPKKDRQSTRDQTEEVWGNKTNNMVKHKRVNIPRA